MKDVTAQTIKAEIAEGLTLVDFWAPTCSSCMEMMPALEELEKKSGIKVLKVNASVESELVGEYRIMGLPQLFWMKDGELVAKAAGPQTLDRLMEITSEQNK